MANRTIRTETTRARFLNTLSATANVSKAIDAVKAERTAIYAWRNEDEQFAKDWDAALDLGTDALEDEAIRRGHEGVDKPVYQGGKLVGVVREYSDSLLTTMLKARRPEKFKDRSATELTGRNGGPIVHQHDLSGLTDEELAAIEAVAIKLSGPATDQGGEGAA